MTWGTPEERERRNRIRVAVAAYAYEVIGDPVLSDGEYDALAQQIDPTRMTGHPVFDEFFLVEYSPFTGMWVRKHPDPQGLRRGYARIRDARLVK